MMMTHIVTRSDAAKPLTDSELCGWLVKAEPGDALEYHRGFLARDIVAHARRLSEHDRVKLARLARCVWWAGEQKLIHLVQRRHGPDDYSYLAIARSKSKKCLASLSSLLLAEVA
jgi:hypothetical protein